MIRVIDVSVHQGEPINWAAVKASGVAGVWCKTGGSDDTNWYEDSHCDQNCAGAAAVGLPHGTYYFARPTIGSGAAQARHAVNCHLGEGPLAPALDLEQHNGLTGAQLDTFALDFLHEVRRLTDRTPIVYTGAWIGMGPGNYFGSNPALAEFPLWIANYGNNVPSSTPPSFSPTVPKAWYARGWDMWQHCSTYWQPGITANTCDQNVATEAFWASQNATPSFEELRMRPIIINGEQAQWRLVDDGHAVLRRQLIDSQELLAVMNQSETLTGDYVTITDPAQIERFRRIPVTGETVAEWGLIQVAANIVKSLQTAIAGIDVGGDLDETVLADALVRHFANHLTNEPPA